MHRLFPFSSKMWINFWGWHTYFYLLLFILFFGMFILKPTDYRIFLCSGWKERPLFQTWVCAFFKPIFWSTYHYLQKGSHNEELRKHVAVMVSWPLCFSHGPWAVFRVTPRSSISLISLPNGLQGTGPELGQPGCAQTHLPEHSFPPTTASWLTASLAAEVVKFFLHKLAYINQVKTRSVFWVCPAAWWERFLLTTFPDCCWGKFQTFGNAS